MSYTLLGKLISQITTLTIFHIDNYRFTSPSVFRACLMICHKLEDSCDLHLLTRINIFLYLLAIFNFMNSQSLYPLSILFSYSFEKICCIYLLANTHIGLICTKHCSKYLQYLILTIL